MLTTGSKSEPCAPNFTGFHSPTRRLSIVTPENRPVFNYRKPAVYTTILYNLYPLHKISSSLWLLILWGVVVVNTTHYYKLYETYDIKQL